MLMLILFFSSLYDWETLIYPAKSLEHVFVSFNLFNQFAAGNWLLFLCFKKVSFTYNNFYAMVCYIIVSNYLLLSL